MNQTNQEWAILQYQFDAYEKFSLIIKLVSILILAWASIAGEQFLFIVLINLMLWGQDAIWKTFQGRIFERLLIIERAATSQEELPIAFNLAWQNTRPNAFGLIKEYINNAFKPTVLFPHLFVVFIAAWLLLIQ